MESNTKYAPGLLLTIEKAIQNRDISLIYHGNLDFGLLIQLSLFLTVAVFLMTSVFNSSVCHGKPVPNTSEIVWKMSKVSLREANLRTVDYDNRNGLTRGEQTGEILDARRRRGLCNLKVLKNVSRHCTKQMSNFCHRQ